MQKRQLPAKKGIGEFVVSGIFAMALIALCQFLLISLSLQAILSGEILVGLVYGVGAILYLWASGSFYISLPLTIYFHRQYKRQSDLAVIDQVHRKAIRLLKHLPFRRTLSVSTCISNLGLLRLCQGEYDSSLSLFSEAAGYCEKDKRLAKSIPMVVLYNNLGTSFYRLDKLVEAENYALKALEIAELPAIVKRARILAGAPLALLATVKLRFGELDEAIEYYLKAMERYETSPVPRSFSPNAFSQAITFCSAGMALCYIKMERKQESLDCFEKFMGFANEDPQQINAMALNALNLLANEYMDRKLFKQAETLLELAYTIGRNQPFHPDAKQTLNYFEKLLLVTERSSEIADMRSWIKPVNMGLLEQKH